MDDEAKALLRDILGEMKTLNQFFRVTAEEAKRMNAQSESQRRGMLDNLLANLPPGMRQTFEGAINNIKT